MCWRGPRVNYEARSALCWLPVPSATTHKQIGHFWFWFPGGWICLHSRTPWVSPMNSPLRLWISPITSTPTNFFHQRLWGSIYPHWNPGLCGLSHSTVVSPGLSTLKCGTTWCTSCCLTHPSPPVATLPRVLSTCCPPLPLLLVWMSVSSLTPWLSDFHVVQFFCLSWLFLFFNLLLSFFWLSEEAQYSTYASIWPENIFF